MRCNLTYGLFAGALIFMQPASGQQIPPAQPLNAPSTASALSDVKPTGTKAAAADQVGTGVRVAPAAAPNVITLSQAASSAPVSVSPSAPLSVPPIVENVELATGKNTRKLDAAGPTGPGRDAPRVAPALVLQRVSYTDNEPRALMKVHGVLRYVQVGSPLLKKVVTSISAEGVCLNSLEKSGNAQKEKKAMAKTGPACAQIVSFQSED